MELIDKSALVAEIERLMKWQEPIMSDSISFNAGHKAALNKIINYLNNPEGEEVDLEDSIKESLAQKYIDYTFKRHNIDQDSKEGQLIYHAYMHGMNQCLTQIKAQKGK